MNIIWLELILVAVVALGLGFWQLYDVNKELKKDDPNNVDARPGHDPEDGETGAGTSPLDSAPKAQEQVANVRHERDA
ncbi:MAG: hypothetical protein V2J42_13220 [Wenzhouxiangella sp.]|nr:hypothetical protein [Wenzhouxiangella sp.]